MRYPVPRYMALFLSFIRGAIVTIIFTITFGGPVTENEVFAASRTRKVAGTEPSYAGQNYGTGNSCGLPNVNVINGFYYTANGQPCGSELEENYQIHVASSWSQPAEDWPPAHYPIGPHGNQL
ncbi:hypothetical protein B0H19DRAFT_1065360 [Mycena capillaripes]|nr:hypothetical protein B0H19DRAFT_1065360 [Mycena capillaripes]